MRRVLASFIPQCSSHSDDDRLRSHLAVRTLQLSFQQHYYLLAGLFKKGINRPVSKLRHLRQELWAFPWVLELACVLMYRPRRPPLLYFQQLSLVWCPISEARVSQEAGNSHGTPRLATCHPGSAGVAFTARTFTSHPHGSKISSIVHQKLTAELNPWMAFAVTMGRVAYGTVKEAR